MITKDVCTLTALMLAHMSKINFKDLSDCRWEQIIQLILPCIEDNVAESLKYIKTSFSSVDLLDLCVEFIRFHFLDGVKSEGNLWQKIGFFPAVEAQTALETSLQHAVMGSYRAAYDDLRRALEMMAIIVLFSSEKTPEHQSLNWLNSEENTPPFSRMIGEICNLNYFREFNEQNWGGK